MNAVYAGSFDMFTNGHLSVLDQAVEMFDKVYVVIAINPNKKRRFEVDYMIEKINEAVEARGYADKVEVVSSDALVVRFAQENGCRYLIRGLRNSTDYAYEENMALINTALDKHIKTIYLRAKDAAISSSMVYELYLHGEDVSSYLPYKL
ncbi:MAG: pantetheine-phosphate adenylyltransferase [Clostridia bacterium]|jgi:pantetheine-phosphate adenylyltransferase|nr:pantetheine-phosphate adenylyltransferase [Clostridia bacterium]